MQRVRLLGAGLAGVLLSVGTAAPAAAQPVPVRAGQGAARQGAPPAVPLAAAPLSGGAGTPAVVPGSLEGVADLDSLVARALAASPLPRAAAARVAAARARVGPAGARPDPMLMAGVQNLPITAPGFSDEMTMVMVGVGQSVPLPGKQALRRRTAEREVEATEAALSQARLEIVRDVRIAYFDLAYLERALDLVERNRAVLVELVRAAEARYGSAADLSSATAPRGAPRAGRAAGATVPMGPVTSAGSAPVPARAAAPTGTAAGAGMTGMGGAGAMRGGTPAGGGVNGSPVMSAGADATGAGIAGAMASGMSGPMGGGGMPPTLPMAGGPLQEIVRARVAVAKLAEDAAALAEERHAVLARLNALLDRPSGAPIGDAVVPARLADAAVAASAHEVRFASAALGARAAGSPLLPLDELQVLAARQSPTLRAHEALIAAQGARVELARRERAPDPELGLQYGARPGRPDMVTATVAVPLPLQRRRVQDEVVVGSRAELAALGAEHHRQLNQLGADVARLHAEAERARTQLALLKAVVLPQEHAALAAGVATYQAGRGALGAVLEARAGVFNQETAYYRALSDFAKAVAALESVVGAPVLREVRS